MLSTDCRLQQMLTLIQSQVATTSDTTEVVTKNQKGALTSEHSTDLFSVHNFDVTIDLAFPSGEWVLLYCSISCWSFCELLLFTPVQKRNSFGGIGAKLVFKAFCSSRCQVNCVKALKGNSSRDVSIPRCHSCLLCHTDCQLVVCLVCKKRS